MRGFGLNTAKCQLSVPDPIFRGTYLGSGTLFEGGLAFALDDLNPLHGPFTVKIQNEKEPILGTVYLCSADANDCFDYDPMQDLCGVECREEGYQCCIDVDTQEESCENTRSDAENCGGCGIACDWDETCLKGICVRGSGESCWDTVCPAKMRCCEDWDWSGYGDYWPDCGGGEFDISCKAVRSDPENCGWCGNHCWDNENCIRGKCKPKHREACDKDCPDSKTCCYKRGEQKCRDLSSNRNFCGSCGTKCAQDEECLNGQCVPWYRANDPCGEGSRYCLDGDEFGCKDVRTDRNNCGYCSHVCPSDSWCQSGRCTIEGRREHVDD